MSLLQFCKLEEKQKNPKQHKLLLNEKNNLRKVKSNLKFECFHFAISNLHKKWGNIQIPPKMNCRHKKATLGLSLFFTK